MQTSRKQSPAIQQHGSNGQYHTITYSSELAESIQLEECDWKTIACSKVDGTWTVPSPSHGTRGHGVKRA